MSSYSIVSRSRNRFCFLVGKPTQNPLPRLRQVSAKNREDRTKRSTAAEKEYLVTKTEQDWSRWRLGPGFCSAGTWVFQEFWVTDFACWRWERPRGGAAFPVVARESQTRAQIARYRATASRFSSVTRMYANCSEWLGATPMLLRLLA
jgi:hypothetical protein